MRSDGANVSEIFDLVRGAFETAGRADMDSKDPYIANAQFHLDWVRVTINDALTGSNDGELKRSLLQDLDAADLNLRKALS